MDVLRKANDGDICIDDLQVFVSSLLSGLIQGNDPSGVYGCVYSGPRSSTSASVYPFRSLMGRLVPVGLGLTVAADEEEPISSNLDLRSEKGKGSALQDSGLSEQLIQVIWYQRWCSIASLASCGGVQPNGLLRRHPTNLHIHIRALRVFKIRLLDRP